MIPKNLLDAGYILEKEYAEGGQSKTYILVKNKEKFILKIPKEENLPKERVFRLSREIDAMKLLDGDGVPKIFDGSFRGNDLYILMEFIEGKTLSEFTNGKAISYQVGRKIFFELLDTIGKAHKIGLYHRDLKPDNIIISNLDGKPRIIDFGICWLNKEVETDFRTDTKIELGNRFLRLPELAKGSNVTVSTSDITFLIGVFFYLLSGYSPNLLLNEKGELPHQRINAKKIQEIEEWKFLKFLFDKGFSYQLSMRYQTTDEVKNDLISMEQKVNINITSHKDELLETLNDDRIKFVGNVMSLMKEAHEEFLKEFRKELLPDVTYAGSGPNYFDNTRKTITTMFLIRKSTTEPQIPFYFISHIDENFSKITTEWGTDNIKNTMEHSISEKNRFNSDANQAGKETANLAMKELSIALKNIYMNIQ